MSRLYSQKNLGIAENARQLITIILMGHMIFDSNIACLYAEDHHIVNSSGPSQNAFNPAFTIVM